MSNTKGRKWLQFCVFLFLFIVVNVYSFLFPRGNAAFDRILDDHAAYATSEVSSILQDATGFIWFGTPEGLYRYDGYRCVAYKKNSADPKSISNNDIKCLYLDRKGNLWIGTNDGLNTFDRETESFTCYRNVESDPHSLSCNSVEVIYEDRNGFLWLGTFEGGLNLFNREAGTFTHYRHNDEKNGSLSHDRVRAICEDSTGALWIGTKDGLNRFDPVQETFSRYKAEPGKSGTLNHDFIWTIYEDKGGTLWVGTFGGGLNRYIRDKDIFIPYRIPFGKSTNRITSIHEDRYGALWVGTRGSGLLQFSKIKEDFDFQYIHDEHDSQSLSKNMVETIYEDKTGLLWIGTLGGGINTLNRRRGKFSHFKHHPGRPDSLSNNTVMSFCEDREEAGDVLWVATYSGLNRFDRKEKRFTNFMPQPGVPGSISHELVRYIYEDRGGVLWVGTDDGLNRFDRKTSKFTPFHSEKENPKSISHNLISTIYEDRKGVLWIGTGGGGLNRFNPKEKSFERFKHDPRKPDSLSSDKVFCIHQRSFGNDGYVLWIGTYEGGLNKFFVERNKFLHFKAEPGRHDWLNNDTIRVICEGKDGVLWLGTNGGLNCFDPKSGTFSVYTEEQGLSNNVVYGILTDEAGHLWLSTGNGLSRFDVEQKVFSNFNMRDGLPVRNFSHNSYCKCKNGEMFFGGPNGFISFFPSEFERNVNIPKIVITDFKIFNKSVGIGGKLKRSIIETDEILLTTKDSRFSFEFAVLDYTCPAKNQYAYKMEGYNDEWEYVDAAVRYVNFENLSADTYIFRVKGSNNDGLWNETGKSIRIIITPPFWHEWWFRSLVLIFFIVIGFLWRTRLLRQKLREQKRVQEILEQSRDEMEKSRNLAEFRSAENEKLIAAISSLFIGVGTDGKIFQWNHSSKKFFRMSENDVIDHAFVELLNDYITPDKLEEIVQLGLHREKPSSSIEIPVRFKINDESKLLLATINPIIDRSGRKFGFLLLAEDITNRKKEQMQRFLSQKLEALGQMAAGIAHEIRSPLQYIGDNGRFLQEAFDSLAEMCDKIKNTITRTEETGDKIEAEELKQLLEKSDFDFFTEEIPKASEQIVNGVIRVSNIVRSMNEFAHTGDDVSGKSDLNEMLKTTLVVAHNRLKKVAEIETDYAQDLPGIPCGMGELNQVFLNLLLNSADAIAETGKHGIIKVSTTRNGSELVVRISDNGTGIPEENKDKIFTPFFTTKGVGKGTGQGLPFSYRIIVERHKGRLYFDSRVGKGTTFYIHLPILESPGEF